MLVLEGRALLRGRLEPVAIGVEDGRIAKIAKTLKGDDRRDFGDALILPGGIDLHVHFRDPGFPAKEDFGTGTAGAAAAGVTTVFDMPNTVPPVATRDAYGAKLRAVRGRAHVDFGLHGLVRSAADVARFAGVAAAGKLYMAASGGDHAQTDPDVWGRIVAAGAETGLPLIAHAEDPRAFLEGPGRDLAGHARARPAKAEVAAVQALSEAARACATPPKIHVTHLTSAQGLAAASAADITVDVTAHHLFLDANMPLGPRGKVNPPLRSAEDRATLWKALVDGRVQAVASDHAPHTAEEKDAPFPDAPAGVPGVETLLPLLLRRVKAGDLTLERFIALTATGPAAILGLPPPALAVGEAATFFVTDPRAVEAIRGRRLHSRAGWTPFEGAEAVFPRATFLRGELVAEGRALAAERRGRPVSLPKRAGR